MKKVLILSALNNYHTIKWVRALASLNYEITVIGFGKEGKELYEDLTNVDAIPLGLDENSVVKEGAIQKLKYFTFVSQIKQIIKSFDPDIVHSHYISSYGVIGAFCKFKPYIISVWGSDIYEFPLKSFLHKSMVKHALKKASVVLSTSHCMADVTSLYTTKTPIVTPFGIDTNKFSPNPSLKRDNEIVIGTVKMLKPKYGIDILIRAFAIVKQKYDGSVSLEIAGNGPYEDEYRQLANELGLGDDIRFLGYVENNKVPDILNSFDIFVALSQEDSESFGVSAVEAMACELPVVVSDVDGFKEVVPSTAGFIIPRRDIAKAADALLALIDDEALRHNFGLQGRENVLKKYDFKDNLKIMHGVYQSL